MAGNRPTLRGFRMDKKSQTSMLRYVRYENKPSSSSNETETKQDVTLEAESDNCSIKSDPSGYSQELCNGDMGSPLRYSKSVPLQSSKIFYVVPLSESEAEESSVVDAKESGFDISAVLKGKTLSSPKNVSGFQESSNQSQNGKQSLKRSRTLSDDEETRFKIVNLDHDDSRKYDPEMIEKLLDTYADLYPHITRMELFEIMERWDYNFAEMTICLDNMEKEHKTKRKDEANRVKLYEREQQKLARLEEREKERESQKEEREKKRSIKAIEVEKRKQMWKMRARYGHLEEDADEEEDYIGRTKVYESESSEEENDDDDEESNKAPARKMVLSFYNEATIPEMASVPSCSKKKAEAIIAARPFDLWRDLVFKIRNECRISPDLLNSTKDVLQMRNTIQKLMKRCEKIASDIQNTVSEIVEGDSAEGIAKQPTILSSKLQLKNYQLIGLKWLVLMHEQELNGVLADEMGLGKTAQSIAFLGHLKEVGELEEDLCLIVVPTSTLDNWARELEQWCPTLGFLTYHGSQEERKGMRMVIANEELDQNIHIILTTYHIISSSPEDRGLFKRIRFHTVIFDEAHMLKNMTSQRYENLMKIRCIRRLLLTGTPLQNNLVELMSILVFVMPKLFEGKKEELKKIFSMFPKTEGAFDGKGCYERERILQAKRIMAPFFLRRLKNDVLKDLPSKTEELLHIDMTQRQGEMYKNTVEILSQRAREKKEMLEEIKMNELNEIAETEVIPNSSQKQHLSAKSEDSSSNMLMKLRKLANHPLLTRELYSDKKILEIAKILKKTSHPDSVLDYIVEDLTYMSDFEIHRTCLLYEPIHKYKLHPEEVVKSGKLTKLDEMLPKMKELGDRVLIFSQFVIVLNIIEEFLKLRGYIYRRLDGSTNVNERQELIDDFNEDSEIFIFLLSTRAGGLGINLSAANVVILHDIDFNPYNDKQAEDRCHRVGQVRSVTVYRFISKSTIEEGMHRIACNKLQLERDVTGYEDAEQKEDILALLKNALGVGKESVLKS